MVLLSLVGCHQNSRPENVYSFSGERDEFRVINGVAVVGKDDGTFCGGTLELKDDEFVNVKEVTTRFYIDDEEEPWTILNNSVLQVDGDMVLTNQDLGKLSGQILGNHLDKKSFEDFLFFEMTVTYDDDSTESFKVPMVVQSVLE